MKRFSSDQLLFALLLGAVILVLTVYRIVNIF
jgi:hypothetical protein